VLSANLHRRHLNETARGMVASKVENMPQGSRTDRQPSANLHKVSRADAARMLGVSVRAVPSAKAVREKGVPSLRARVESGELAVSLPDGCRKYRRDGSGSRILATESCDAPPRWTGLGDLLRTSGLLWIGFHTAPYAALTTTT
jgi:hypothetical protein